MSGMHFSKATRYTALLMLLTLPGCTGACAQQAHIDKLGKDPWMPKYAIWPEFANIMSQNAVDPSIPHIGRLAMVSNTGSEDRPGGGVKPYCLIISNQKFQDNIKRFDDAPIPNDFSDANREANKKALVAALNDLKESCAKKVADKELEEKVKKIIKLKDDIYIIPGQKRPEGTEAEKYAPER